MSGHEPVREFILQLSLIDRAAISGAMKDVEREGLQAARHLQGAIHEARASGTMQNFRILFAAEGHHNQILLALEAFSKKTQKTPPREIALAESRLTDWHNRSG